MLALVFDAMILQQCRDVAGTRQHAEEGVSLATELALGPWLAWGTALRGWAIAAEGRTEEGIADLRQAVAGWTAAGVGGLRPYFLALLAEVYTKAGQRDRALATLAEAFEVTEQTREGYVHIGSRANCWPIPLRLRPPLKSPSRLPGARKRSPSSFEP
ncbi:MAG: hypothetical protein DMG00_30275 [Acidobacteria bacterium]|nr:MAG: hypothetical protein DMG00_30275 [Acidobacteriota bacterium]